MRGAAVWPARDFQRPPWDTCPARSMPVSLSFLGHRREAFKLGASAVSVSVRALLCCQKGSAYPFIRPLEKAGFEITVLTEGGSSRVGASLGVGAHSEGTHPPLSPDGSLGPSPSCSQVGPDSGRRKGTPVALPPPFLLVPVGAAPSAGVRFLGLWRPGALGSVPGPVSCPLTPLQV